MTKKQIENKSLNAAKVNFIYINQSNALIKDSLKKMARQLFVEIDSFTGDPRTFRMKKDEKQMSQQQNTKRIRDVVLTYMALGQNTANRMNMSFGLKPVSWDVKELANEQHYDKTLSEHIDAQSARAVSEAEVYAALALKNGYSRQEAEELYFADMEAPHRNRQIAELAFLGYLSLKGTDILRPRKGGISSAYKSLSRINEDYMMRSFAICNSYAWKGLTKYIITAGDAGVCQVCQDNARMIFPADEFVVPAHNRCRCIEVPILDSSIPDVG